MAAEETSILAKRFLAGSTIERGDILKLSNDNTVVPGAASTDFVFGVAENDAATGAQVRVMMIGIAMVKAGGTITRGDLVRSNASGHAEDATTDDRAVGLALQAAASGDLFAVLLGPSQVSII